MIARWRVGPLARWWSSFHASTSLATSPPFQTIPSWLTMFGTEEFIFEGFFFPVGPRRCFSCGLSCGSPAKQGFVDYLGHLAESTFSF